MILDVSDVAVWNKYREELIRYASMLVGPADSEDLVSTVVVRILHRRQLSDLDDPRSYLYRSVLNEARSLVRHRRRERLFPGSDVWPREVEPEVLAAVVELPERQRAAVYLTYWRDLPIADVADLMGCRPGTVKRYLHLARNRLREVFQDD